MTRRRDEPSPGQPGTRHPPRIPAHSAAGRSAIRSLGDHGTRSRHGVRRVARGHLDGTAARMTGMEPAQTPEPPYTAVIFTSIRTDGDNGYDQTAEAMEMLAAEQPGFLGIESARSGLGITVSYWVDQAAARSWKAVADHRLAQRLGRERWYRNYRVRVATVELEYGFTAEE